MTKPTPAGRQHSFYGYSKQPFYFDLDSKIHPVTTKKKMQWPTIEKTSSNVHGESFANLICPSGRGKKLLVKKEIGNLHCG